MALTRLTYLLQIYDFFAKVNKSMNATDCAFLSILLQYSQKSDL